MKVKYLSGDRAGEIGYLSFGEAQELLAAGTVEAVEGDDAAKQGDAADKAETREIKGVEVHDPRAGQGEAVQLASADAVTGEVPPPVKARRT